MVVGDHESPHFVIMTPPVLLNKLDFIWTKNERKFEFYSSCIPFLNTELYSNKEQTGCIMGHVFWLYGSILFV